ncbi:MAG: Hpt protein [Mucilaginibacter sp.]|jgi:HPt (histidine-containing phosphotransfer) domain-containing protein|nr:Hpt protein [Mucilaginibacter sp.]
MSDIFPDKDLDLTLLHEIADGSDEFIVESINMFLQQAPISLQDVNDAAGVKDWEAVAAAAHKLKATLGFFGMFTCQALIQEIEQSCKTGAPNEFDLITNFTRIQVLVAANTEALIKIKDSAQANL